MSGFELLDAKHAAVTIAQPPKRIALRSEGALVLITQVVLAATGLFVLKLTTNTFEPKVVAQIALAMTAANLISQFFTGPMIIGTIRYASRENANERLVHYLNMALLHILVLIAVLVVLLVAGSTAVLMALGKAADYWFVPVGLLIGCILSLNNFATSNLNALRERGRVAFLALTESALRIGAIAIIFLAQQEVGHYLVLLCSVLLAQSIFGTWLLRARPSVGYDSGLDHHGYRERLWRFSKPIFFAAVPFWVYSSFDKWLVNILAGEQVLAGYAVMLQIGFAPVMLVFGFIRRFAYPIKVNAMEAGDHTLLRRASRIFFIFFTTITVLIALLAHFFAVPIVRLMTSSAFEVYSHQLVAFVIGAYFFACGQWFTLTFEVAEDTNRIFFHRLFIGIAMIGCFLIYAWIVRGEDFHYAFLATNLISAVSAALLAFRSRKSEK